MTVGELLARISSRELTEWRAYETITGPLGPPRADLHAGIIAATIANIHRGKGSRALAPGDFIPRWDRRPRTPEELWKLAIAANAGLGGKYTAASE